MPAHRPLVSVVLPIRNTAKTVSAALESLSRQDMADFEIMAVDDGSTDDTAEVLQMYSWIEPRLRVIHQEHAGIVSALNTGIQAARGGFIARMDADDECMPERLRLQSGFLLESPEAGLVSCLVEYGGDRSRNAGYAAFVDWTNSVVTREEISLMRFVESPLPHPSVMFRKDLVDLHGGYRQGAFPEDYELWLRWLEAGVEMRKIPKQLLVWNDPPDRLSRVDGRYSVEAFYRIKSSYLARWLERFNPYHPEVVLIGSGRTTRKRAEMLEEKGVEIAAYVDVDSRKIGREIAGRPVLSRAEMPGPGECFALSYVASRGAREDIRAFLESRGFVMGVDCLPAA
jgi:glycosyltransferase involved in cell wall biosynthesis